MRWLAIANRLKWLTRTLLALFGASDSFSPAPIAFPHQLFPLPLLAALLSMSTPTVPGKAGRPSRTDASAKKASSSVESAGSAAGIGSAAAAASSASAAASKPKSAAAKAPVPLTTTSANIRARKEAAARKLSAAAANTAAASTASGDTARALSAASAAVPSAASSASSSSSLSPRRAVSQANWPTLHASDVLADLRSLLSLPPQPPGSLLHVSPSPLLHSWTVRAGVLESVAAPVQAQGDMMQQTIAEMEQLRAQTIQYQQRAEARWGAATAAGSSHAPSAASSLAAASAEAAAPPSASAFADDSSLAPPAHAASHAPAMRAAEEADAVDLR